MRLWWWGLWFGWVEVVVGLLIVVGVGVVVMLVVMVVVGAVVLWG